MNRSIIALCTLCTAACLSDAQGNAAPAADLQLIAPDLELGSIPLGRTLRLRADRPLEPSSVLRQSFGLADLGTGRALSAPVRYDPVLREVQVDLIAAGLSLTEPGHSYTLRVWTPNDKGVIAWFRGVDGSVIGANSERRWTFRVEDAPPPSPVAAPDFCADILPTFRAQCTQCHNAQQKTMALDLSSGAAIAATAVGVEAVLSRRTPGLVVGTAPLGTNMQRITPRTPSFSQLLYKTLIAPSFDESTEDTRARRLLNERISGEAMGALSMAQKRTLSAWIQAGAPTNDCL